jgi:serine/threonine-protein kinase RsbW
VRCKVCIADEIYYNILIAATEAVNNAIVHGNKLDPSKYVMFCVRAHDGEIIITVKDEGNGFDTSLVQDPRLPQNLLKDGGRGVFLMRQLSSTAEFFDGGRGIKMIFKL